PLRAPQPTTRELAGVHAVVTHDTPVWTFPKRHAPREGRLPGTRRAEDAEQRTRTDGEGGVPQRHDGSGRPGERLADVLDSDHHSSRAAQRRRPPRTPEKKGNDRRIDGFEGKREGKRPAQPQMMWLQHADAVRRP